MTVSNVTAGGAMQLPHEAQFSHETNRLTIVLDPPTKAGELRQFKVTYRGVPGAGLRIGLNRHNERTVFGLNWPDLARQWLPLIDHPYVKATSEFTVIAPAKYQVVSNGLLQEEDDPVDGRRLTHWKQSVPIVSWLMTIGVAQFEAHHAGMVRGVELQTWGEPFGTRLGHYDLLKNPRGRRLNFSAITSDLTRMRRSAAWRRPASAAAPKWPARFFMAKAP